MIFIPQASYMESDNT